MTGFGVKPLDETTWPDFARWSRAQRRLGRLLVHGLPRRGRRRARTAAQNRSEKECRVREGRAHAALVYDGDDLRRAGASSGRPTSCRASSTGAPTSRARRRCRTGGSPASSSTRGTGAEGVASTALEGALERDRPARGRHGGELPRGRRGPVGLGIVPPQRHGRRCSSARGSSEPVASASTAGSSPRSCRERRLRRERQRRGETLLRPAFRL